MFGGWNICRWKSGYLTSYQPILAHRMEDLLVNAHARLSLERLDERLCPSVRIVSLGAGQILRISGDAANDRVAIVQHDDRNELTITQGDGTSQSFRSATVQTIIVDLQGGNDVFLYRGTGKGVYYRKDVRVDLGQGKDEVVIDTDGTDGKTRTRADLRFSIQGGDGDDTMEAAQGTIENRSRVDYRIWLGNGADKVDLQMNGDVQANARLGFDIDGGNGRDDLSLDLGHGTIANGGYVDIWMLGAAGDDSLDLSFTGTMHGVLHGRLDGSAGHDKFVVDLKVTHRSVGSSSLTLNGGAGNDSFQMNVFRQLPLEDDHPIRGRLYGLAIGGDGEDAVLSTSSVQQRGCEKSESLVVVW